MSDDAWDRLARWRDERMGDSGDLWHRAILDPTLLEVIGPVRGLRVLDLACGAGYLARRFAREGARSVVGVDLSSPTVSLARAREERSPTGARFEVGHAAHLPQLATRSFDLVVAHMALMDIEDAEGTLREVARLLDPGGRFVFSLCHPCFDTDEDSMWVVEHWFGETGVPTEKVWRKVSGYRDEGQKLVPWDAAELGTVRTPTYRRTLATYSRLLRSAGFVIARLEEPMPLAEAVEKSASARFMRDIPLHLIVEAIPGGPGIRSPSQRSARSPRRAIRRSGPVHRRRGTGSRGRGSTAGS
jgi:SAM-dependent methyltransferase